MNAVSRRWYDRGMDPLDHKRAHFHRTILQGQSRWDARHRGPSHSGGGQASVRDAKRWPAWHGACSNTPTRPSCAGVRARYIDAQHTSTYWRRCVWSEPKSGGVDRCETAMKRVGRTIHSDARRRYINSTGGSVVRVLWRKHNI